MEKENAFNFKKEIFKFTPRLLNLPLKWGKLSHNTTVFLRSHIYPDLCHIWPLEETTAFQRAFFPSPVLNLGSKHTSSSWPFFPFNDMSIL